MSFIFFFLPFVSFRCLYFLYFPFLPPFPFLSFLEGKGKEEGGVPFPYKGKVTGPSPVKAIWKKGGGPISKRYLGRNFILIPGNSHFASKKGSVLKPKGEGRLQP